MQHVLVAFVAGMF